MVGGVFVRRAKNWMVNGKHLSEEEPRVMKGSAGTRIDVNSIVNKIATLDVRALSILRNRIPGLYIPLACIVDYYGTIFECQSPVSITQTSLAYGSDSEGILFKNDDLQAEQIAKRIGEILNIRPYQLSESISGISKTAYLPYNVQIHNGDKDGEYFLVNAYRLFPNEEPMVHKDLSSGGDKELLTYLAQLETYGKQLRPEHAVKNHNNEPAEGMNYYTWKIPQQCSECGGIIQEYTYYYYEKRAVNKMNSLISQYYCCLKDYEKLAPTESLQVPRNKLQLKELQGSERQPFWLNTITNQKFSEPQFKKMPLNPDAFVIRPDQMDGKSQFDIKSDQEEIIRSVQRMKDENIKNLIRDLNDIEEDPLNPTEIKEMMHRRGIPIRYIGKICT